LVTSAPKAPTVHPSTTTVPDEGDTAVLQASPARSGEHDSGLPLWLIVVLALGASSLLSVVGFRLNARLR